MGKPKLKAIVPVWARRIEVEEHGDSLWITGWGHTPNPISTREIGQEHFSQLDILQRFRNYALRHLGQQQLDGAGVYQFADAHSSESQISFCREFGPIWGEVRSSRYEDNGTYTVTVIQKRSELQEDQERFGAAVRLLQQINQNGKADRMALLSAMQNLGTLDPGVLGTAYFISEVLPLRKTNREKVADLLPFAHIALCGLLNDFPRKLFPLDGEVIELPDTRSEGIRDAIYYQLRLDYMAQRTIDTCLNCGGHFPVYRRGSRSCKPSCQRALRNRGYWERHKTSINRTRRKKGTTKKELEQRESNGTQQTR
jgi:hypothetical protein